FDLAVGHRITSAYSGSADKERFNVYPPKSEKKAIKVTYTDNQKELFGLFDRIARLRDENNATSETLDTLFGQIRARHTDNWLIHLELLGLAGSSAGNEKLVNNLL